MLLGIVASRQPTKSARLRALKSDLFGPTISVHRGRVMKRTGDGVLIEFRSVVDAVRCSIEVQNGMVERNAGRPQERQILFRVGVYLGDVIEEGNRDLLGNGINFAARLGGISDQGKILSSRAAKEQIEGKIGHAGH
jgi:adenylate cyclase